MCLRRDGRHLVEWAALDEFLEPAHLCDVELRAGHAAVVAQMNRDLRVPFNAGDGIDRDLLHGGCRRV